MWNTKRLNPPVRSLIKTTSRTNTPRQASPFELSSVIVGGSQVAHTWNPHSGDLFRHSSHGRKGSKRPWRIRTDRRASLRMALETKNVKAGECETTKPQIANHPSHGLQVPMGNVFLVQELQARDDLPQYLGAVPSLKRMWLCCLWLVFKGNQDKSSQFEGSANPNLLVGVTTVSIGCSSLCFACKLGPHEVQC